MIKQVRKPRMLWVPTMAKIEKKPKSQLTFESAISGLHVVTRNVLARKWGEIFYWHKDLLLGAMPLTRQQKAQLEDLMFEVQNELEHQPEMLGAHKVSKGTRHRVEQLMAARNVLLDMLGENVRPEGLELPPQIKAMRWPAVEKMRRKMLR